MNTLCIIPASIQPAVNAAIWNNEAFVNKREHEFTVPLYDAEGVLTHYWLSHPFTPEQRAAVGVLAAAYPGSLVFDYDDPSFPQSKLAELGLSTGPSGLPL